MRAGLLKDIITITEPVKDINEVGEQYNTYIKKFTTKAQVVHSTGNREIENNEVVFNYSKTFKLRYYQLNAISEFDRIEYNSKQYRILSIEPNKQYQEITILAELIQE